MSDPIGLSAAAIVGRIREEILSGALIPGQRLGEQALADRFSVSRGPVREALRSLAETGLVVFVPNVGVRVHEIGFAQAQALYELREALETESARLAARRVRPEQAEALFGMLRGHSASMASHPDHLFEQGGSDNDFHVAIAEMAGNPLLARLLTHELYPQLMLLRRQNHHVRGRGLAALEEHRQIASAIADHDEELSGLLMRRHIRSSWASLKPQIQPGQRQPNR